MSCLHLNKNVAFFSSFLSIVALAIRIGYSDFDSYFTLTFK